jgi:mono/diheme cytochrome c family protein
MNSRFVESEDFIMRIGLAFLALIASAACTPETKPSPPSPAARAQSAAKGLTIVEKWCAECHRVKAEQRAVARASMGAPDFADIAARPEVNGAYLARFMEVQHLPMTTFRLYSDEKADVVAYMLSLKSAH